MQFQHLRLSFKLKKLFGPTTPRLNRGLGCSHFARRYLGNRSASWRIAFFSSAYLDVSVQRVPSNRAMYSRDRSANWRRVAPFGNLRVEACSQLTEAYRREPRPSSAKGSKASFVCAYFKVISFYSVFKVLSALLVSAWLATPKLEERRVVDLTGLEPVTFALQMQCSKPAELQAHVYGIKT